MHNPLGYIGDMKQFNINDYSREQLENIRQQISRRIDDKSPVAQPGENVVQYVKRMRFHYPKSERQAELGLFTLKCMFEAQQKS